MFQVEITYKSGKVENTEIKIGEYTSALEQLCKEGRMTSMSIKSVK